MNEHLIEHTIDSKEVFNGVFMRVYNDTVKLPDGTTSMREFIKHGGAVAVIALTKDNQIVLERQYRYSVGQTMIEIPAGKLEKNEDPLEAAKRELQEETGYTSTEWEYLGFNLPCIGYSTEKIIYFLAKNVQPGTPKLDEGEFLETFTLDYHEFVNKCYAGEILDGKSISGLVLYQGHLQKTLV